MDAVTTPDSTRPSLLDGAFSLSSSPSPAVEDSLLASATEHFPLTSQVVAPAPALKTQATTVKEAFTRKAQQAFRVHLDAQHPGVTAKLDQAYGKDNLRQCFRSEASLRHILLPLWKSGFLHGLDSTWAAFSTAYYPVQLLHDLLGAYGDVDFSSLQGFPVDWASETTVNMDRVAMVSAALLHFDGSAADLVRWVGGPHVAAHRDHSSILATLSTAGLPPSLISTLDRIFNDGIPAACNVDASEANFQAYYNYGNHATVDEDPEKTYKAMLKDNKRGYTLLFDPRLVLLLPHCHITPQGLVDLNTMFKNPRPVFDSSFRPSPRCFAINDWTSKDTEPPLTFAGAELQFMVWVYNLRISYPSQEIYIADDDVSGAFRWLKYHPNLVALHTSIVCGLACLNTGGTFGDNTTPSNFDPIALARRLLAKYLWLHDPDSLADAAQFLPPVETSPPPTPEDIAAFCPADPDPLNPGVLDAAGHRLPPQFDMHVDDNMYADILHFLLRTIQASVAALFILLGRPDNPDVPPPLSFDKLETSYNHKRKLVGRLFNSRRLTVGMLPYKRSQLLTLLQSWLLRTSFTLPEIAQLLGTLENHTRYTPWARPWYFSLQNAVRRSLHQRFSILQRKSALWTRRASLLRRSLPPALAKRLSPLIARDKAKFLWATDQSFSLDPLTRGAISALHHYVADTTEPWETPLGMIIPRAPQFLLRGDASFVGGGAYCDFLQFWTDLPWSPRVRHGCNHLPSSHPEYVHINFLEFIMVIIQDAAVCVRLRDATPSQLLQWFPTGVPHIPYYTIESDNQVSVSWANSLTARGLRGQHLLGVAAEFSRTHLLRRQVTHLAGKLNIIADDISRNDFSLPFPARATQVFVKHPSLASYDYFLPSPDLLLLLSSRLFCGQPQAPCALPKNLGRFVPAGCTTFTSPIL